MKQIYTKDDTFLARWIDDNLSDKELSDFKKSEDYLLFEKIAKKSTQFEVPTFNEDKVFEKIQAEISKKSQSKVKKLIPNWAYATAAALLVLVGLSFFFKTNNTSYECLSGEQLAFNLPDGSQVQLNGKSVVSFDQSDWKNGVRTLELKGQGYFKVKKGSKFSVSTKNGTISVLGTQFNVLTLDDFFAVECYEGKVQVENSKYTSILTPGKGVKYYNNQKENYIVKLTQPNWMSKNYEYNAIPLSVIFKDLENIYKVKIANKGVDLSQKYSGKLITSNLEKALTIICLPMNINYSINNKIVEINN